jgi:motility quorum-sensing regulator/GCU-specific mRNA interferase toxin
MVYKSAVTEKRTPTYDLDGFKKAFATVRTMRATGSAIRGAAALGLGSKEIVSVIQTMEGRHFYKSMTSYASHKSWQDVYHVP